MRTQKERLEHDLWLASNAVVLAHSSLIAYTEYDKEGNEFLKDVINDSRELIQKYDKLIKEGVECHKQ
jgi:hypothetical protein